jgi:hypothetical protein
MSDPTAPGQVHVVSPLKNPSRLKLSVLARRSFLRPAGASQPTLARFWQFAFGSPARKNVSGWITL